MSGMGGGGGVNGSFIQNQHKQTIISNMHIQETTPNTPDNIVMVLQQEADNTPRQFNRAGAGYAGGPSSLMSAASNNLNQSYTQNNNNSNNLQGGGGGGGGATGKYQIVSNYKRNVMTPSMSQ